MKHMKRTSLSAGVMICAAVLFVGCSKQVELSKGWTPPVKVTESKDGLVGGVNLYRWHNTAMALQGLDDGSAKCFLMKHDSNSWSEVHLTGVPHGYFWAEPAIDQTSDRVLFEQGYMENDQLVMNVLIGRMNESFAVRDVMEKKWFTDKKAFWGNARSNILLNDPGKRDWPSLGIGVIDGSDIYIPYSLIGEAWLGNGVSIDDSLFSNGVFHSSDSGVTWQLERISDFEAWLPSICKTKTYYYYLGANNYQRNLWFARKSAEGGRSWDAPKTVTKTFADSALYWKYVATAESDTVHLCWLDRRHEKARFNLMEPHRGNYEVAYCQRKDSDSDWSKAVILSKGLFYSYRPSMSVEGDKIVVAWSGIETSRDGHVENGPNDIYYVTSKDGGKTWATPLKLTDGAKDGIASGEPQVMLLNGVIHLFYIQGKRNSQQISPGLTLLNQPPWPIYYTQRPFPD